MFLFRVSLLPLMSRQEPGHLKRLYDAFLYSMKPTPRRPTNFRTYADFSSRVLLTVHNYSVAEYCLHCTTILLPNTVYTVQLLCCRILSTLYNYSAAEHCLHCTTILLPSTAYKVQLLRYSNSFVLGVGISLLS